MSRTKKKKPATRRRKRAPSKKAGLVQSVLQPENYLKLILLFSLASIGFALFYQYVVGLNPCILCLYQRVPYILVILIAMFALLAGHFYKQAIALCGLLFFANAVIATYHTGIENGWWAELFSCKPADTPTTLDDLILSLERPYVDCKIVAWRLFGISMSGYNAMGSLALTITSFLAVREKS